MPTLTRALSAIVQLPRYEGYGMTPLEGMASAVPFVSTDAGYYRSFSGQGTSGSIVPEDAPQDTATALSDILTNPAGLHKMARAARTSALTHFSVKAEADGIAQVYAELWSNA